jgi:HAD superfamily hydrolase (TIGR01509 family)
LLANITIIAFDLDDTLWPCMPTIERAEQTLYRWLQDHYPRITDRYNAEQLVAVRKHFMTMDKRFAIDMSLMRHEFLKRLAVESGYDPNQVAELGFDIFYQARQDVSFYDDVLPCLERLQSRFRLGTISNGNANVEMVGLGHLIEHAVSASELQVAKPDKLIFHHLVERFSVSVDKVLYVGDHPAYDVVGSIEAGLQAVWINRENSTWPDDLPHPKYQVSDLHELELLL